ncbi:MAG: cytochrome c biogenesis protein CcsA [Aquificae bacterium]|nr:cytochrome c biogenesis protein CcsA [Aquificota bacterium]
MASLFLYLLASLMLWAWAYREDCLFCKRLGLTFLGAGFLTDLLQLLFQLLTPEGEANLFKLLTVVLLGTYYFILWRFKRLRAVALAPLVASLALLFSAVSLKAGFFNQSGFLLTLHVATSLLAFTLLVLSGVASVLRMLAERRLKRGNLELPLGGPLRLWIKLERRLFFFGFVFLTVDLILNLLWAAGEVGSFRWDARVVSTLLLWVYYGLLFHLERFGVKPFKEAFGLFNALGAAAVALSLALARHSF